MSQPISIKQQGQLEGLKYALNTLQSRRVLRRSDVYLAALEEMEIFLEAAIERVENGDEMSATCSVSSQRPQNK
jgi:hypothetical protein